jgi:protein unc-45
LLQAACELLDDPSKDNEISKKDESSTKLSKKSDGLGSVATSALERAIEMITYLIPNTIVKEELAAGFGSSGRRSAIAVLVEAADLPDAGESLSGYGLATIFQNISATSEQLRKEGFEGKEVTMEQYDEMQRMGKTEEEKELMDKEKDPDTLALCHERIRQIASANVPRALIALVDGASEHTLEQVVMAMNRMAEVQSVRGILIQQGVLSSCIKIETKETPTDTDVMKKVTRLARHTIAKMLVTTNPTLLTSAQRLGSIKPLIQLIRDIKANDLQHFEALMALTNIASSGEDANNRIVTERGIPCLHFAMFSDHEMVRRAATEAMCNLVPHKAMMDHLAQPDNLKLWLAFAVDYEDNYDCARAAAGCLAMATQDEIIAEEFVKLDNFRKHTTALLESGRLELMHRTFALVHSLVQHGGKIKERAISEGLVDFCRAYIELQQHSGGDLEFSEQEKQILPVTVDIAKQIVKASS